MFEQTVCQVLYRLEVIFFFFFFFYVALIIFFCSCKILNGNFPTSWDVVVHLYLPCWNLLTNLKIVSVSHLVCESLC